MREKGNYVVGVGQRLTSLLEEKGFIARSIGVNSLLMYTSPTKNHQFKIDQFRNTITVLDKAGFMVLKNESLSERQVEEYTK